MAKERNYIREAICEVEDLIYNGWYCNYVHYYDGLGFYIARLSKEKSNDHIQVLANRSGYKFTKNGKTIKQEP